MIATLPDVAQYIPKRAFAADLDAIRGLLGAKVKREPLTKLNDIATIAMLVASVLYLLWSSLFG